MSNVQGFLNFPKQKISDVEKMKNDKQFYKDCVDFAENFLTTDNGLKQSFKNKNENYNLRANIIDRKNVERTINPDRLDEDTLPVNFQHIGLGNNKINLLIGEYIKRKKEFKAYLSASDKEGIGRKEVGLKKELTLKAIELIQKSGISPEEMEAELKKLEHYIKYDFQDIAEIVANKVLKKEIKENNIEFEFTRTFEDLLTVGEEVMFCAVLGNEAVMRRIDTRNIFSIGGNSMFLHDSDLIVEYGYHSVGQVLDDYYDKLSDADVEYLETGNTANSTMSMGLNRDISIAERYGPDAIEIFNPNDAGVRLFSGAFDTQGNVRVVRSCWAGKRKIGRRTYFDEDGVEQEDYVSEKYKVDEDSGETVKWEWVKEWQWTTKIADQIYVDMEPIPYSSKSIVNKSKGTPPYVGLINSTNNTKAQGLMDIIKPLDYSYDIAYFKRELEAATFVGSMTAINSALVPSGMDPKTWMHYAKINKFMWLDPTNEILKGPSQGKSAGVFNTMTATSVNVGDVKGIQMYTDMMYDIEDKIGKLSGVHGGREGQIQSREAVGNVEREVTQTSHITEKWFNLDSLFRKLALTKYLECCKYAYKKNPKKAQYILDDMGMAMISHFDEFVSSQMDIHIANSSADTELFNDLEMLAQAAIQNGNATIADLISIKQSESIQGTARKLEESARRISQEQQQMKQAEIQSNERIDGAKLETEKAKQELEKYKIDQETAVKYAEIEQKREASYLSAGLDSQKLGASMDSDKNGVNDELDIKRTQLQQTKDKKDAEIKEKALKETVRHNKATEKIASKKAATGTPVK